MTIHMTIHSPRRQRLRLFRGEDPALLGRLQTVGVTGREPELAPGFPGLRLLHASALPADLVPDLAADVLYEHVVRSSSNSPFASFTMDERVARRYSLAGGARSSGLLVSVEIDVEEEYAVEAHPTWRYGSFRDTHGRAWIRIDGCNVGADPITREALVRRFQANGSRDSEYLVLGGVSAWELQITIVKP